MTSPCRAPKDPSFTFTLISLMMSALSGLSVSGASRNPDSRAHETAYTRTGTLTARSNHQGTATAPGAEIERILNRATEMAKQGRLREALDILKTAPSSTDLPPAY